MKTRSPLASFAPLAPLVLFAAHAALAGFACASGESGFAVETSDASFTDDAATGAVVIGDAALAPVQASEDSGGGALTAYPDDAPSAADDGAAPPTPVRGPPFDAGEGGVCAANLEPGSLAIVELMIESTSGTGDHGEWLEVENARDCALDLKGLHGECPTGAKVNTFDVAEDVWIPGRGAFVVADSSNPAVNHSLPGLVIPWSGQPGDALRNTGATVTLLAGGTILDSVTYPKEKLTPGVSLAFPSDCPRDLRSDWTTWQSSTSSWFPAFLGTPGAPNTDVLCPPQPDD